MSDDNKIPPSSTFSRIKTDLQSALDQWEQWERQELLDLAPEDGSGPEASTRSASPQTPRNPEQKLREMQLLLKELHAKMKELKLG